MEEKMVERPLMSEEEFKEYLKNQENLGRRLYLKTREVVGKFKSIRRAIRRGHMSLYGAIYPNRPFNNRANTCKRKGCHSRLLNEERKRIYEQLKHRQST